MAWFNQNISLTANFPKSKKYILTFASLGTSFVPKLRDRGPTSKRREEAFVRRQLSVDKR